MELTARLVVFLLAVGAFTLAAAVWDMRTRRIPNKLTLPVFLAGLVFQLVFNGWSGVTADPIAGAGLGSGLLGFLTGFGTLWVLWLVGGGGGGDVKLMGALSVWLGFPLTLQVLIASTLVVLAATVAVLLGSVAFRGARQTKEQYVAVGRSSGRGDGRGDRPEREKYRPETVVQKQQRRIMAYALPVAVATWGVLVWNLWKLQA